MIFIAQADNKEYTVEVRETALKWQLQLTDKKTSQTQTHSVAKKNFQPLGEFISFIFNHRSYLMDIVVHKDDYTIFARGSFKTVKLLTEERLFLQEMASSLSGGAAADIHSGMPGRVVEIPVKVGDKVTKGDLILVMEAMKMENEILAPGSGIIKKIYVKEEQSVSTGVCLMSLQLNTSS